LEQGTSRASGEGLLTGLWRGFDFQPGEPHR
jgi:hypothetical protein